MLACPMISWSIFGGYPAWIISDAAVCLRSCTRRWALIRARLRADELVTSPVRQPEGTPGGGGEDEVFRPSCLGTARDSSRARNRGSGRSGTGATSGCPLRVAADIGVGAADIDPAADQVHIADA